MSNMAAKHLSLIGLVKFWTQCSDFQETPVAYAALLRTTGGISLLLIGLVDLETPRNPHEHQSQNSRFVDVRKRASPRELYDIPRLN